LIHVIRVGKDFWKKVCGTKYHWVLKFCVFSVFSIEHCFVLTLLVFEYLVYIELCKAKR